MSNDTCGCGGSASAPTAGARTTDDQDDTGPETDGGETASPDRWLGADAVVDVPLPPDVQDVMTRFYGAGDVETLADFVTATRAGVGDRSIAVEELCHAGGETPHRATTDEETYHFQCFYDGVALAHLVDEPVDVRTESPAGEPVELRATPDGDVDVTPEGAAMSFGIAADAGADGEDPSVEDVYGAVCPYVKAFPSRERYEAWATGVDAATVGLPLAAGMPVAAALTADG